MNVILFVLTAGERDVDGALTKEGMRQIEATASRHLGMIPFMEIYSGSNPAALCSAQIARDSLIGPPQVKIIDVFQKQYRNGEQERTPDFRAGAALGHMHEIATRIGVKNFDISEPGLPRFVLVVMHTSMAERSMRAYIGRRRVKPGDVIRVTFIVYQDARETILEEATLLHCPP